MSETADTMNRGVMDVTAVLSERVQAGLKPGETLPVAEWLKRTSRDDWHFCCPGDCELEPAGGAA